MKRYIDRIRSVITSLHQLVTKDVWQKDYSKLSRAKKIIYNEIVIVSLVIRGYSQDRLAVRASALVYSTLLSIVPLLAVTFSLFKGFGFHLKMEPKIAAWAAPLGNEVVLIVHQLIQDIDKINFSTFGFIGLAFLLASLSSIVTNIERAFNDIWRIKNVRSIQRRFADYTGAFIFIPMLLIGIPFFTAAIQTMPILRLIRLFPGLEWILNKTTPFVISWLTFSFFYIFVPNTHVRVKSAITGAFIASLLWQITSFYFTKSIITTYETGLKAALYASFAGFLLLLVWLYLTWTVVLLGAEASYVHQNQSRLSNELRNTKYSFAYLENLSLQILLYIARCFLGGAEAATRKEIGDYFKISERLLKDTLEILVELHFIYELGENGREARYTPARDLQKLSVNEFLSTLRTNGTDVREERNGDYINAVVNAVQKYHDHLVEKAFENQTIKDLIEKNITKKTSPH
ncbi:MAG: YihY/virulence factor BrkB family protein [Calditrichaeota bacterium]|nr:MAG: YihY/virulence factor BrkB family protein [Calditrichota bacterium]